MRKVVRVVVMSACFISYAFAQIQPVVKSGLGDGEVDWGSRMIVATGIGAPNPELPQATQRPSAMRAAQMVALRNALETVKGINLNSTTTIQNMMTTDDRVTSRVDGFISGFQQQGRTKYMSDGTVEITMEIPLDQIAIDIFGDDVGESPSVSFKDGRKDNPVIFTGLVIDCRDLDVKPALSPKILDENGLEIYGSAYVSREWASKHGIVGYVRDLAQAVELDRVGDTPGKVKALRASGPNRTDVVIARKDAEDIRSAAQNLKFLSECRVVLVID